MITFEKKIDMMSKQELRNELSATREIIDDIYNLTKEGKAETVIGKQNIVNQIARYCYREMPK